MTYKIYLTKEALKDIDKLKAANLYNKVLRIRALLATNPKPQEAKKLIGDLKDCYSIRINLQHRFVYIVDEENKLIKVLRMWSHYE